MIWGLMVSFIISIPIALNGRLAVLMLPTSTASSYAPGAGCALLGRGAAKTDLLGLADGRYWVRGRPGFRFGNPRFPGSPWNYGGFCRVGRFMSRRGAGIRLRRFALLFENGNVCLADHDRLFVPLVMKPDPGQTDDQDNGQSDSRKPLVKQVLGFAQFAKPAAVPHMPFKALYLIAAIAAIIRLSQHEPVPPRSR